MFLESVLECLLKDNVTLETVVMMLKIQLCFTGINYIFKYIQIENVILNCNNILQYYVSYCIFDQINAALFIIRDLFQKHKKYYQPQN